ncbi:MAG TPA: DUF4139 domain-containing protein [Candidatus Eisenbacteria bacterium]|nr:DUF4139 domain-containing protein [Candidatus Eisenbacteria bacterium]
MNGKRHGGRRRNRTGLAALVGTVVIAAGLLSVSGAPANAQTSAKTKTGAAFIAAKPGARDVAVTVYNDNLGVVKDRRPFTLTAGVSDLRFTDVASAIDPTSVHLRALGRSPIEILWQDYRYDLVNTEKLLDRYIDLPIDVSTKDDQVRRGTLLSHDGASLVLQDPSGGLTLLNRGEVRQVGLKEAPKGLITRPTLVWHLRADAAGEQPLEVSYMTGGLAWHAEYVAVLDAAETSLDLQGWASVDNRSGATYDDAKIKLVAGSIHRAQTPRPMYDGGIAMRAQESMMKIEERAFFEYHLYEVPLRATISNNEVKQLGLLHAQGVKTAKRYTYDATRDNDNVLVTIEFENASSAGLGMPLPEGVARVFKRDQDGSLELAGEDRIKHTPKNERVRLSVGNAFDIGVERKQADFRQVTPRITEQSFEITLRNHKSETVDVIVSEHTGGDWELVKQSHPSVKKDATTFEFTVRCAPEQPVTVTYTVRTRS